MSINSTSRTAGPYTGTGLVTTYPFTFKVFQESDLLLARSDVSGAQTYLTLSSDYTVTLNPDQDVSPGGIITLVTALPSGYRLTITSNIPTTQPVTLTNTGGFFPKVVEGALDRLTILFQQLGLVGTIQSLRVPEIGGIPSLPAKAARASKVQAFDSNGDPTVLVPVSGSAADVLVQLADSANAALGPALLGYNAALAYGSGLGKFLNYQHARTAGEIAAGVTPTNYAYFPGDPRRYGAAGDGSTDDTLAIQKAIQAAPDGGAIIWPPLPFKVTSIDATPQGSITIYGYGAKLVNTAQVATLGVPILRLRGSASKDIAVCGLEVSGPRLTSSTTVGTGVYASNGYPSGIDIYTARRAVVIHCRSNGTYFAGIEAHYCTEFYADRNKVENHGYAGILFSDCGTVVADGNRVDDVGSTMVTDGYGITASTSYNSPTYNTPNGSVVMVNNHITKAKRKGLDVHDGLDAKIIDNTVKGFGYAGIYAVCEGTDKQVRDVLIQGNKLYGDTGFVASAASQAIVVGSFGTAVAQQPSFTIKDNFVSGISCAGLVGAGNNATAVQKDTRALDILDNMAVDCAFTTGISLNNYTPGRYQAVQIRGNKWIASPCSSSLMTLPYCDSLRVTENTVTGTLTSTLIDYTNSSADALVENNFVNGNPIGSVKISRYTDGTLIETTLALSGSLSNLNLLSADLGVSSDNGVAVQIDVLEMRASTNGIAAFSYTAYGTRVGSGSPSWTPAAATNMTAGTVTLGAATAPKLIWNVVGNVGTLQFQPQDTFATYIIRARAVTYRGTVVELAR